MHLEVKLEQMPSTHACPSSPLFLIFCGVLFCLKVTEEQSYALLEYVIHLIAKDYPATLEDLIILGFISPEVGDDPEKVALVVPLLAKVCALTLAATAP